MSSSNLDLVRSIFAEWERGDYSAVDWQEPDIEFVIADGPTPGAWTGSAGIAEGWGAFLSAWEGFYTEVDEYREVDDERVIVFTRWGGRGKASGLPAEAFGAQAAGLFHMRDGKVRRLVLYFDRDRALADLGRAPDEAG